MSGLIQRLALVGVAALGLILAGCSTLDHEEESADESFYDFQDPALDRVTSRELERFRSEASFRAYLRSLQSIVDDSGADWSSNGGLGTQYAQAGGPEDCPPEICPFEGRRSDIDPGETIVVTGSTISTQSQTSITNVQTAGVDEGDIVKMIGPYLVMLQDGRLFAVDTRNGGLRLTDRHNVYRDKRVAADWYDEILVEGERIIVTAYNYRADATEISVIALDQASGKFTDQGTFFITSDDYYSSDNYATRIIGDRLIIYTPYDLERYQDPRSRPVVRRWRKGVPLDELLEEEGATPLFGATDIYRPVLRTGEPTIHTVSICQLTGAAADDDDAPACKTTGLIGPRTVEMFVSTTDIYLWNWPYIWSGSEQCKPDSRAGLRDVIRGAIYKINVLRGDVSVVGIPGRPENQFSMETTTSRFMALTHWTHIDCDEEETGSRPFAFLSIRNSQFSNQYQMMSPSGITALPDLIEGGMTNRFANGWLLYGSTTRLSDFDLEDPPSERNTRVRAITAAELSGKATRFVAVPTDAPARSVRIPLQQGAQRIEPVGKDAIIAGYATNEGLSVSNLRLTDTPSLSEPLRLDRRFESEGRSHSFNARADADGGAIMAVPTTESVFDAGRWVWRSEASDLSFLTRDRNGNLSRAGDLQVKADKPMEGYRCEVSCIDWYGNTRPIFYDGRIFGLLGAELVEARLEGGQMREMQRLNITAPVN
jgi:hypothetical protein